MRHWCRLAALAITGVMITVLPQAAAAATNAGPEPWEPHQQPEWTAPAGRYCDFPLHVDVLDDKERARVLERYPDGAVKQREYIGMLVVDMVNLDTGARLHLSSSAQGIVDLNPDGSLRRITGHGPFGSGFGPGDAYPQGYYTLTGMHVIEYDADGTKRMAADAGQEENICPALAS